MELNTFKDVASALREGEEMRQRGEVQSIKMLWHDVSMTPVGVCACGVVALVAGMKTGGAWSDSLLRLVYPVMAREVTDPEAKDKDDLLSVMSHLHWICWGWTRIADWLDNLPEGAGS